MHHFANLAAFRDKSRLHSFANANEMMMDGTYCQKTWNGNMPVVDVPVGKNDVVVAIIHSLFGISA